MKLLFDFFPILLFFLAYKFYGIYSATIVAMVASLTQVGFFWLRHRKIEIIHYITLLLILILGAATLLSHNAMFIKWKPTALYWVFTLLLTGSQIIGKKPFVQYLMGGKITLPGNIWQRLNLSWALFFALMGGLNLYIAYNCNTNVWVNFKLFGTLTGTLLFGIMQSLYIAKYLKNSNQSQEAN